GHNQPSPVTQQRGDTTTLGHYHGHAASDSLGSDVAKALASGGKDENVRVDKRRDLPDTKPWAENTDPTVQAKTVAQPSDLLDASIVVIRTHNGEDRGASDATERLQQQVQPFYVRQASQVEDQGRVVTYTDFAPEHPTQWEALELGQVHAIATDDYFGLGHTIANQFVALEFRRGDHRSRSSNDWPS